MFIYTHKYVYTHIYIKFICVYIWPQFHPEVDLTEIGRTMIKNFPRFYIYINQFHPEVDLTENGRTMIKNFLQGICAIQPNFTPDSRHQVGNFLIWFHQFNLIWNCFILFLIWFHQFHPRQSSPGSQLFYLISSILSNLNSFYFIF